MHHTTPLCCHRRQALPAQGIAWRSGSARRGSHLTCAGTREHPDQKKNNNERGMRRSQSKDPKGPERYTTTHSTAKKMDRRKGPNRPPSGMEWDGIEWKGMERNGMELNGMEWNGPIPARSCEKRKRRGPWWCCSRNSDHHHYDRQKNLRQAYLSPRRFR